MQGALTTVNRRIRTMGLTTRKAGPRRINCILPCRLVLVYFICASAIWLILAQMMFSPLSLWREDGVFSPEARFSDDWANDKFIQEVLKAKRDILQISPQIEQLQNMLSFGKNDSSPKDSLPDALRGELVNPDALSKTSSDQKIIDMIQANHPSNGSPSRKISTVDGENQTADGDVLENTNTSNTLTGNEASEDKTGTAIADEGEAISKSGDPPAQESEPEPQKFPADLSPDEAFSMFVTNEKMDNLEVKLPTLLGNFTNPCWVEQVPKDFTYNTKEFFKCTDSGLRSIDVPFDSIEETLKSRRDKGEHWRVRCFPKFYILAHITFDATKFTETVGTYIDDIIINGRKDLHYWEHRSCSKQKICNSTLPHRATFADYLDTLDTPSETLRTTVDARFGKSGHHKLTGDIMTFNSDPCWQERPGNDEEGAFESTNTLASYIHSILPTTKFIFILNDPVERFYQEYRTVKPDPDAPIHKDTVAAIGEFMTCKRQTKSLRACAYMTEKVMLRVLLGGLYEIYILDWIRIFPLEKFLFVRLEDFEENKKATIERIISFLGTAPVSKSKSALLAKEGPENHDAADGGLPEDTRGLLQGFYRPYNRRLATMAKDPEFAWGY